MTIPNPKCEFLKMFLNPVYYVMSSILTIPNSMMTTPNDKTPKPQNPIKHICKNVN